MLQVQLLWAYHVTRTEFLRMPKTVLLSELQEGKRHRGALRKRYEDQLKRQLAQEGINHQSWQQMASDRDRWRSSVRKRISRKFAAERHEAAKERRRKQKEPASS